MGEKSNRNITPQEAESLVDYIVIPNMVDRTTEKDQFRSELIKSLTDIDLPEYNLASRTSFFDWKLAHRKGKYRGWYFHIRRVISNKNIEYDANAHHLKRRHFSSDIILKNMQANKDVAEILAKRAAVATDLTKKLRDYKNATSEEYKSAEREIFLNSYSLLGHFGQAICPNPLRIPRIFVYNPTKDEKTSLHDFERAEIIEKN